MYGIRRHAAAGLAQRHARHLAALRPDVRAGALLAEFQRALDDAELRVDFQRARLHAQRPRLQRRPGMPVDDHGTHAAPRELVGEHQPGRAGADDQDVRVQRTHSGWIFAACTTCAHFTVSLRIRSRKASGVPPAGSLAVARMASR